MDEEYFIYMKFATLYFDLLIYSEVNKMAKYLSLLIIKKKTLKNCLEITYVKSNYIRSG